MTTPPPPVASASSAPPTDALFRWIERQEASAAARPWGRVLDAGTGYHSLQWLTSLGSGVMTELVAVTGEKPLAQELQQQYEPAAAASGAALRVLAGNWADASLLQQEPRFDVIIADYLVGSIEGFAPYFQDELFPRLRALLAPRGRLYVVGLEPITETPLSLPQSEDNTNGNGREKNSECACCVGASLAEEAALVREMARLRDACILLAGRRCYREFPLTWTQRQLRTSGLLVGAHVRMRNVYTTATVQRQVQVARRQLPLMRDDALASAMAMALDRFDERVAEVLHHGARKIHYGFDYVVAATASTVEEEEKEEEETEEEERQA